MGNKVLIVLFILWLYSDSVFSQIRNNSSDGTYYLGFKKPDKKYGIEYHFPNKVSKILDIFL